MRVLVLGSTGFVGRWVVEKLRVMKPDIEVAEASLSLGVDLRSRRETHELLAEVQPDYVINCAAYVGGIQYGYKYPADFFRHNMRMIVNVFEACCEHGVRRLVQPISNCAYPAEESYFREENFWNGPLHESVMVYGMTRKMMWAGAWAYARQHGLDTISLILSNMYGPGDHYDVERSHAFGALVRRIVEARETNAETVTIWGSGRPVREWLYVEEGAEALVRALDIPAHVDIINVGAGEGISIKELAEAIQREAGWSGRFEFDLSKPDGAPEKVVDGTRGREVFGWSPTMRLEEGVRRTVADYVAKRSGHRCETGTEPR